MIHPWRRRTHPRTPDCLAREHDARCRGARGAGPRGTRGSPARRCGSRRGAPRRCCTGSGPGPRRRGRRTARRRCARSASPGGRSSRTVRRRRISSPSGRASTRASSVSSRCTVLGPWWQQRPHATQSAPAGSGSPVDGGERHRSASVERPRQRAQAAGARRASSLRDRRRRWGGRRGRGAASTKSSSASGGELGALARAPCSGGGKPSCATCSAICAISESASKSTRPVSVSNATQPNA